MIDKETLQELGEQYKGIIIECYGPGHFNGLNQLNNKTILRNQLLTEVYSYPHECDLLNPLKGLESDKYSVIYLQLNNTY